jgi:hypothetical protein
MNIDSTNLIVDSSAQELGPLLGLTDTDTQRMEGELSEALSKHAELAQGDFCTLVGRIIPELTIETPQQLLAVGIMLGTLIRE